MRWFNSFPFSPARWADWSFLFFLYLTPCWFITFTGEAQTSDKLPNQDSINYYLQIIDEGENRVFILTKEEASIERGPDVMFSCSRKGIDKYLIKGSLIKYENLIFLL